MTAAAHCLEITDIATIYGFGGGYLTGKAVEDASISAKECHFCHIERATPEIEEGIREKGYYIVEMEGC